MEAFALVSDGGGTGKTTTAAGLGKAAARKGRDVLVVDMDKQAAGFTSHMGLLDERDADVSLLDFMAKTRYLQESDELQDIIHTVEPELIDGEENGIDVIPSHEGYRQMQSTLGQSRDRAIQKNPGKQLLRVLNEAEVYEDYDLLIVDAPASSEVGMDNAVYATRNVLLPVESSSKGEVSNEGMVKMVEDLTALWDFDLGVIGTVANKVEGSRVSNVVTAELAHLEANDESIPVAPIGIQELKKMAKESWMMTMTPFTYVELREQTAGYRNPRDTEVDTLEAFWRLEEFVWERLQGSSSVEASEVALNMEVDRDDFTLEEESRLYDKELVDVENDVDDDEHPIQYV